MKRIVGYLINAEHKINPSIPTVAGTSSCSKSQVEKALAYRCVQTVRSDSHQKIQDFAKLKNRHKYFHQNVKLK